MPRHVDHAQRRRELLDAAAAVIAAEGIDAATVRRVAAAGGCTTGMVTHYFASKDDLLIGTIRQVHRRTAARMLTLRRGAAGLRALRAVLTEALPLTAESQAEWRVWLAYWGVAWTSQPLIQEHRERYGAWRKLIASLLAEAAARGEIRPAPDLDATAGHLIAAIDGLGIQAIYDPDRMTPGRLLAAVDAELARLT